MKKIFKTLTLAAGVFAMASCSDFLDQTSPTEKTPEQAFNTPETTNQVVSTMYGLMTDATYGQYIPIIFGTNTDCELVDGLGTESMNTTNERGNMNYNFDYSWKTLDAAWQGIYKIVNYSNLVIDGVRASQALSNPVEKEVMEAYLGEALTLRAMCYLDLTRLWGDVPYVGSFDGDGTNLYNGKTDRDVILDRCITDLQEAAQYLPWAGDYKSGTPYTTERVTKGYALGLLSQVALTRAGYAIREESKSGYENLPVYSDAKYPTQRPGAAERRKYYEIAANAAAEIIKSGKHHLNPSFENEWELVNQLKLDNTYYENLFEVPNGCGVTGELGYTAGVRINGETPFFGVRGNSSGKLKMTGALWMSYHATPYIDPGTGKPKSANNADCYIAYDSRRDVTIYPFEIRQRSGRKIYNVTYAENIYFESPACTGAFALYCGKWNPMKMSQQILSVAQKSGDQKWATGINYIRMRYSQVLLNYAEACYELGGIGYAITGCPTAKQALMDVHKRSCTCTDHEASINDASFMEALYSENAWEFAGEGVRKYDLIRWGQLSQKILEAKIAYMDGVVKQPSQGGWPRYFYYRWNTESYAQFLANGGKVDPKLYTTPYGGLLKSDPATYNWFGVAAYPKYPGESSISKSTNCQQQAWFGTATENDRDIYIPALSDGLNPWSDIPGAEPYNGRYKLFNNAEFNMSVKNRYILPIGANTLSDSNGSLRNSYGFQN